MCPTAYVPGFCNEPRTGGTAMSASIPAPPGTGPAEIHPTQSEVILRHAAAKRTFRRSVGSEADPRHAFHPSDSHRQARCTRHDGEPSATQRTDGPRTAWICSGSVLVLES